MKQTKNFVIFWEPGFGDNPETAASGYKVPLTDVMKKLEEIYVFYRDELKFVEKGSSKTDSYKMVVFLFYDKDWGTAYGGGLDNTAGVMFIYPSRIQSAPYGVLAHELGHSFQYMVGADGHAGLSTTAWEMTSQYQLWQFYENWPTFEAYHVAAFMNQSHLAFMHSDNQYHSPFVLEYWTDLHGKTIIGDLWNKAVSGDDFVTVYKRINGSMTQTAFNDEMFCGVRSFVTWDLKRRNTISHHANNHTYKLDDIDDGWLQVPATHAPQNYGYNAVKLNNRPAGTIITADFKGLSEAADYNIVNKNYAGWRYGFVAYKGDGTTEYSEIASSKEGRISYTVPANTTYLWFAAMGAPAAHFNDMSAQWPYQVKFGNTNMYGKNNNPSSAASIMNDDIQITIENKQLSVTGFSTTAIISIYNLEGIVIEKKTTKEASFSTTLPEGVYIANIQSEKGSCNKKIIIN